MITKVIIRDNTKSPINYTSKLKAFENGTEYNFSSGVNIIVGENGCGKTTLLNLIEKYLLVGYTECNRGRYNSNINALYMNFNDKFANGVDVYADYEKNTFRLSHSGEKEQNQEINTFNDFGELFTQKTSSTGEGVLVALNSLFQYIFSKDVSLSFDYHKQFNNYPEYINYVKKHRVSCDNEWTILMDEPDRNLSLDNIEHIKSILSFHKENTQIIAVIHNPLLIYALSNIDCVNWIEMSDGYIGKLKRQVNNIIKNE